MLQKHFQHSNSFRILSGYHKFQPSFTLYSNLPFCDTEFVKKYLTSKLDNNQKNDKGKENKCNDSNDNNNTNTTSGLHQILEIETRRESNNSLLIYLQKKFLNGHYIKDTLRYCCLYIVFYLV